MQTVYAKGFGLHPPYQFLLDPSFCRASLRYKFDPKERLPFILGAPVRPFVTGCVMHALRQAARASSDPLVTGAPFVARRVELRRCRHDNPLPVTECFHALIGEENPFRYGVATDDEELKTMMRRVPGVPLVYMERAFPLLEAPTKLTRETLAKREAEKLGVPRVEAAIIQREFGDAKEPEMPPKHKRRRAKGPNPLSVKRPTKVKSEAIASAGEGRKRRRRRKKAPSVPNTASSQE